MTPRRLDVTELRALAGCALVLALGGCGMSSALGRERTTYSLMQMNLCLSGLAGCYGKVAYPAGVREAAARIRDERPDAVTINEACRGDAARIARQDGYHLRFSRVVYRGALLPCVRPSGRGLFGDAVLTKAPVAGSESHAFRAQAGVEARRWLCVRTRGGPQVCTAHLDGHASIERAANAPQCAELRALLARRAAAGPVVFGGDLNRRGSCAPAGFHTETDASAGQSPGLQQVYAGRGLSDPSAEVIRATHTDHDFLLVRFHGP